MSETVTLLRQPCTAEGTIGDLFFLDQQLVTIELPWRGNKRGLSCVPAGQYEVAMAFSNRFSRDTYHLRNVPGRTYIEMHPGNWAGDVTQGFRTDLDGCIALGRKVGAIGGQKAILLSQLALADFETAMKKEPFTLIIKDPVGS